MQPTTNNNLLAEIGAILGMALLIIGGALLLFFSKIDTAYATSMFILAGAIFAGNLALKAPSPTQQAALLSLAAQVLQTQQAQPQLVQAPAPVVPTFNPSPPQSVNSSFPYPTTSYNPPTGAMPQAIMTTQNMPVVPK